MKKKQLVKLLAAFNDDDDVMISVPYGDEWLHRVAVPILDVKLTEIAPTDVPGAHGTMLVLDHKHIMIGHSSEISEAVLLRCDHPTLG